MPVQMQVVSLMAGTRGYLDNIPVADVLRFESELLEHFTSRHASDLEDIVATGKIADEVAFEKKIAEFAKGFTTSDGQTGPAPDAGDPGDASTAIVDADNTLPEEEITAEDA